MRWSRLCKNFEKVCQNIPQNGPTVLKYSTCTLTRALLGLWIFHHLLGGVWTPPSISAPGHRRTKRKTAFESSRKIISKSFGSFFGSGQNWGNQGSKFQNFPKRFLDDRIFNVKTRATILIPSCLSRQGASNHVSFDLERSRSKFDLRSSQGKVRARNAMTAIPRLYRIWFSSNWQKTVGDLEWPLWPLEGSPTKNFTWSINKYLTWCDSIHISSRCSIKQGV